MPEREVRGVNEHPGIEVLSAYVDGTLDDHEQAAVEAHVAQCEDCLELVTEVMHTQPDDTDADVVASSGAVVTPSSETRGRVLPFTRRRWVWAAAVVAAAAVLLAIRLGPRFGDRAGNANPLVAPLVAAVGEQRYFEPRLTGGFSFGPLRAVTRSASDAAITDNLSLLAAAGDLQKRASEAPAPGTLHAYGVAQLLVGQSASAAQTLRDATVLEPDDPRIYTDLAAALLVRASARPRSDDLPAALAAADEALARDDSIAEAWFNRALVLEALALTDRAISAWEGYLQRDPAGPWAEEARQRIARLRQVR